jgi:hypothetical protein
MAMLRLANGRIVNTNDLNWSPSAGGGTMYDATRLHAAPFAPPPVRAPLPGLTTRKVTSVPIGPDGNPVVGHPVPTFQTGMLGRISPPSVLGPAHFARMNANDIIGGGPEPKVTQAPAPHVIDAVNPLDASRLGLTRSSPASAPDLLTGSGRSTALPFPLQGFRRPTVEGNAPAFGGGGGSTPQPVPIIEGRDQAWVDQGPDMEALKKVAEGGLINGAGPRNGSAFRAGWGSTGWTFDRPELAPARVPLPRERPSSPPPVRGTLRPITFKRGDTVGKLAKERGMTVTSFADLYGIANPDRIYAGDTVTPRAPMPRMPARSVRPPPQLRPPRETADEIWAEAKGY